jgi:hypothetical protein
MAIPRHRNVEKSVEKVHTLTHRFQFKRADLLRMLRLPEDAVIEVGGREMLTPFTDDSVLQATCTETK